MSDSNFADRLTSAVRAKGNPCVVGLDPRLDSMPDFVLRAASSEGGDVVRRAIVGFHRRVLAAVADRVPAVKLQVAFYEQYGVAGMQAFADTIAMARDAGLVVLVDAKRNDIASTAQAYANAFLGCSDVLGRPTPAFDVDCITVSPFLGRDSLEPFVSTCAEHGKGIFVLVKTSNPGSVDIQDHEVNGETISAHLARLVDELGSDLIGSSGYSSIGAVVGATFPGEAEELRSLMPRAIVLVPGFGAQGGSAEDAVAGFNSDGLGAVVNASRSITYAYGDKDVDEAAFTESVKQNVNTMVDQVSTALEARTSSPA
jgi:orotidine-5'-phosphate decarboxylase